MVGGCKQFFHPLVADGVDDAFPADVAAGLDGPDVARVIALAGAMFWIGVASVGGCALVLGSAPVDLGWLLLSVRSMHVIGACLIGALSSSLGAGER